MHFMEYQRNDLTAALYAEPEDLIHMEPAPHPGNMQDLLNHMWLCMWPPHWFRGVRRKGGRKTSYACIGLSDVPLRDLKKND